MSASCVFNLIHTNQLGYKFNFTEERKSTVQNFLSAGILNPIRAIAGILGPLFKKCVFFLLFAWTNKYIMKFCQAQFQFSIALATELSKLYYYCSSLVRLSDPTLNLPYKTCYTGLAESKRKTASILS